MACAASWQHSCGGSFHCRAAAFAAGAQRVRVISLPVKAPDGQQWRMAMITAPFFPVATPEAFYGLLVASGQKDNADAMKNFAARHPEIGAFGAWAKSAPFTESYAEERYNGLDSFLFTNAQGVDHVVRWSLLPVAPVVTVAGDELAKRPADFLEQDIAQRVAAGPQRWTMAVQLANATDPVADPSKAWPDDRRTVEVGTLVNIQSGFSLTGLRHQPKTILVIVDR